MKLYINIFIVACFISLVAARGCIYDPFGACLSECPEGTYSYAPGCSEPIKSERTCNDPIARNIGELCDYSRCECEGDKVKDESTGKCVDLKDCPKKHPGY